MSSLKPQSSRGETPPAGADGHLASNRCARRTHGGAHAAAGSSAHAMDRGPAEAIRTQGSAFAPGRAGAFAAGGAASDASLAQAGPSAVPKSSEAALLALLAERTGRYTMGDSSSVRIETAQELLAGIVYCIDLCLRLHPEAAAADTPLPALFDAGLSDVRRLLARGRLLLRQAESQPPPVTNGGYTGTLAALPAFFRLYDPAFFAVRVPCDIDYPLSISVPETVQGVEYINAYLRQMLAENSFLRLFPAETLRAVYAASFSDDPGLLLNLYLPVAETAVGCALAGRPVRALLLHPSERESIVSSFSLLSDAAAVERLLVAAETAARALGVTSPALLENLSHAARELLPRLRAAAGAPAALGLFACAER